MAGPRKPTIMLINVLLSWLSLLPTPACSYAMHGDLAGAGLRAEAQPRFPKTLSATHAGKSNYSPSCWLAGCSTTDDPYAFAGDFANQYSDVANQYTALDRDAETFELGYNVLGSLAQRFVTAQGSQDPRWYAYVYDDEQRLLRIDDTVSGDLRAKFEYDALGRLIYSWTQLDSNTGDSDAREVWYYHDGGEAIAEYEPLGGGNLLLLRRHIRGTARVDERAVLIEGNLGGLPGIPPTAECYYYILQDLDTVAAVMKQNGNLCEGMVYAGYGRATTIGWPRGDFNRDGHVTTADVAMFLAPGIPWSGLPTPDPVFDLDLDGDRDLWDRGLMQDGVSAAPERVSLVGNPFAFTGRRLIYYESEPDPNGEGGVTLLANEQLQFNRNRWYDLETSRWLTRDPKGYADGMSLYEYCQSNPTKNTDPMGTFTGDGGEVSDESRRQRAADYRQYLEGVIARVQTKSLVLGSPNAGVHRRAMPSNPLKALFTRHYGTPSDYGSRNALQADLSLLRMELEQAVRAVNSGRSPLDLNNEEDYALYERIKHGGIASADIAFATDRVRETTRTIAEQAAVELTGSAVPKVVAALGMPIGRAVRVGSAEWSGANTFPILNRSFSPSAETLRLVETYDALIGAANQAEMTIGGIGRVPGTYKHAYAEGIVKGLRRSDLAVEESYLGRQYLEGGYGSRGSIRADVVLGENVRKPMAIFDFKFGQSPMRPTRLNQLYENLPEGVRIIIVRPEP